MPQYLKAEEGPLSGLTVSFETGVEWILGRDPDEATVVLEDPGISRRHAICRLTDEGIVMENLSSVNPSLHNGQVITEPTLLRDGDTLQIGNTRFRFFANEESPGAEEEKKEEEKTPELTTETEEPEPFSSEEPSKWLLKVISGPNTGAEFSLYPGMSYVIGKDPDASDVVFYDLSVSKQHAKITVTEENQVFLEDLGSKNGTYRNGNQIREPEEVSSQDLIALGTTSFLLIDQEKGMETVISLPKESAFRPPLSVPETVSVSKIEKKEAPPEEKNWKETVIPFKHLIIAGAFGICLLFVVTSTFSLFRSAPITTTVQHESDRVREALNSFPSVQYFFNEAGGKLFLIGHVLTTVDKQELSYAVSTLPFIRSVEDTVVIDELVWQNINALFSSNPDWQAVACYATAPGKFVLKGYVQTLESFQQLCEYINANFPYPDLLDNRVFVENNLQLQIQAVLTENEYSGVSFLLTGGELVLSGNVDERDQSDFSDLVTSLGKIPGITSVKNFVTYSVIDSSRVDLSDQYKVSGFSVGTNNAFFVVINQKIISVGDMLNGMIVTDIQPHIILLEKDGVKFKIHYNLQ